MTPVVKSQNGWGAVTSPKGLVDLRWITGKVLPGDVLVVFDYLCERFNTEVEPITRAHSWGWAYRAIRGATTVSNHASATAVDVNAPAHPLGKRGTFSAEEVAAIRRILAALGGVVRWGGDYSGRADEMHFEINASAAKVAAVAAGIKAQRSAFAGLPEAIKATQTGATLMADTTRVVVGNTKYVADISTGLYLWIPNSEYDAVVGVFAPAQVQFNQRQSDVLAEFCTRIRATLRS